MEYEEQVRGVFVLRLFDEEFCEGLIGRLRDSDGWKRATVNVAAAGGAQSVYRARTRAATAHLIPAGFGGRLDAELDARVKPLVNRAWHVNLKQHSGSHVVRYAPGGHYVEHTDSGVASHHRLFSVVCYLNDDFTGGHTSFPRVGHSVTPATGMAVVFPSNFVHRADPVLEGEKFVLVTWLTGPPPVRWI